MDGLNPDSFSSFQELVGATTATDSRPPQISSRPSTEPSDNHFDIGTTASNSVYRFPSMQTPFNHPSSGHFMPQPVQPLPLPYSQVTHIPTSAHSYHHHHGHHNTSSFSNGSLSRTPTSHNFSDDGHDYLSPHNNSTSNCSSLKTQLDDKRKGNVSTLPSLWPHFHFEY